MQSKIKQRTREKFVYNPRRGEPNVTEKKLSVHVNQANSENRLLNNPIMNFIDITVISKLLIIEGIDKFIYKKGFSLRNFIENAVNIIFSDNFTSLKIYSYLSFLQSLNLDIHKVSRAASYILTAYIIKMVMSDSYNWKQNAIKFIIAEYSVDSFLLQ